jgi:hypothetical protein
MKRESLFLDPKNRRSNWVDFTDGFLSAYEFPVTLFESYEPKPFPIEPLKPTRFSQPSFNTGMGQVLRRFYQFMDEKVKARDEHSKI